MPRPPPEGLVALGMMGRSMVATAVSMAGHIEGRTSVFGPAWMGVEAGLLRPPLRELKNSRPSTQAREAENLMASPSSLQIQDKLVELVAREAEVLPEAIDVRQSVAYYGLDSATIAAMSADVEEFFGFVPSPALSISSSSIEALAIALAREALASLRPLDVSAGTGTSGISAATDDKRTLLARKLSQRRPNPNEPIAIIGMGCRFPRQRFRGRLASAQPRHQSS